MDVIKRQVNFLSCNFGLKSYLQFQIEINRMILDQIATQSVLKLPL